MVPHVEHFLSRQSRDNLSQTLQRLLLAVENRQMEPAERRGEKITALIITSEDSILGGIKLSNYSSDISMKYSLNVQRQQ